MKQILITALIIFSFAGCKNDNHRTRTERMEDNNTKIKVEDNGNTLSIEVQTKNTENPIDYDKNFDVRNMSDKQKKELEKHILDSLGVKNK